MTKFMSAALAASVFVPAFLGSAVPAQAEMREAVTVSVHHADLDLRQPEQRAKLDARIRHAAAIACGPMTRDLRINGDIARHPYHIELGTTETRYDLREDDY